MKELRVLQDKIDAEELLVSRCKREAEEQKKLREKREKEIKEQKELKRKLKTSLKENNEMKDDLDRARLEVHALKQHKEQVLRCKKKEREKGRQRHDRRR